MFLLKRLAILIAATAAVTWAQPALTTIQDILYLADGTRFNGTIFISWNAFEAGDTSNIATAMVKLPIVNGVLNVQLVPTTTASAGANYNVTYNSQGSDQFTQVWAVPPSASTLRVKDVLVSEGQVVGGNGGGAGGITSAPIQISDVVGLTNALALTAQKGVNFALGRAAIINSSGMIDGASGALGNCVLVSGASGPCGGGGVLPQFSDNEVPGGTINGSNSTFTLQFTPSPSSSLQLYLNGLLMDQGVDYTVSGSTITFALGSTPQGGDLLLADYRYASPTNPLGSLTTPQVVCSSVGLTTSSTSATPLATCTLPAGLLGAGDRIEVRYLYSHTGTSMGFTPQVAWAGTPVVSRTASSADATFSGTLDFGITSSVEPWSGSSFGSVSSFVTAAGSASANITQSITISFLGQMAASSGDSITLSNFAVIRYPAQVNP